MHHSKVIFKSMISADDTGQIDLQAWVKKLSGTWMRCPLQSTLSAKPSTLEGDLPYLFRKEVTVSIRIEPFIPVAAKIAWQFWWYLTNKRN